MWPSIERNDTQVIHIVDVFKADGGYIDLLKNIGKVHLWCCSKGLQREAPTLANALLMPRQMLQTNSPR